MSPPNETEEDRDDHLNQLGRAHEGHAHTFQMWGCPYDSQVFVKRVVDPSVRFGSTGETEIAPDAT